MKAAKLVDMGIDVEDFELEDGQAFTIAEYLQFEEASEFRHEFIYGQVRAMSGGTGKHSRLKLRVAYLLEAQLEDRACMTYNSDFRIRPKDKPIFTYPDLSIGCPPMTFDADDPNALNNPIVLIEVLSPSTERYDRGKKFLYYRHIASLREYMLVSQKEIAIEVFRQGEDGTWLEAQRYGAGERVRLVSIDCELAVDDVYKKLEPPPG